MVPNGLISAVLAVFVVGLVRDACCQMLVLTCKSKQHVTIDDLSFL